MASAQGIHNLADKPEWLPVVAAWHHQEWQKGRTSAIDGDNAEQSLSKRYDVLRKHLGPDLLPSTFIASIGGDPVGSASIVYYQFTRQQRSEWLTNVYVAPACRRQGIAEQLITYACDYAATFGIQQLKLYTRDHGDYYQQRGWQRLGVAQLQGDQVSILKRDL